jgi:MYND finger
MFFRQINQKNCPLAKKKFGRRFFGRPSFFLRQLVFCLADISFSWQHCFSGMHILNPNILFMAFPRITRAFAEKIRQHCQQLRREAKEAGRLKSCRVCRASSQHCKRCANCFLVWYCGAACQKLDWAKHKAGIYIFVQKF